ncbi:MAG: glycosyltransferase family 4 protein [Candidatus Falkowbacteria bacterium]
MKKFLLFTLEYPPFHGGVANYYGNLVKYWPKSDEISVLNNNDGRLINNKLPLLKWLPAYFALAAKIKQKKIEHVLVGHILPLGTVALICSWFCKIKYSVILHGLDLSSAIKKTRKKWLAEKILKNAEKIICINSYVADLTKQFFPASANKIAIVNPGVENRITHNAQLATQIRNKYQLNDKIVLLSVGRLVKRKGFDKVIEALPETLRQASNLVYVILGNGAEFKNYELSIANYELKNKALIINNASDPERNSWYNLCDIFIMTSRNIDGDFEGFGIVYLEANLAGKPVIAGKAGGVEDAVINGLNSLLVDPEDTNQITSAIIKLAQNPELRKKLGEQGRERAIKEFNWPKQANKIYNLLIL